MSMVSPAVTTEAVPVGGQTVMKENGGNQTPPEIEWTSAMNKEWEKLGRHLLPVVLYTVSEGGGATETVPLVVGEGNRRENLRVFRWPDRTYLKLKMGDEERFYGRVDLRHAGKGADGNSILVAEFPKGTVARLEKKEGYKVMGMKELIEEQVLTEERAKELREQLKKEFGDTQSVEVSGKGGGDEDLGASIVGVAEKYINPEIMSRLKQRFTGDELDNRVRQAMARSIAEMNIGKIRAELDRKGIELPSNMREMFQVEAERRGAKYRGGGD